MSDETEPLFKASPIYLVPIAISILVGILCSLLFIAANIDIGYITIMPESLSGSAWNAAYFVILIAAGAYSMYFLLKRKIHFGIRLLIGVAISIVTFMLSLLYLESTFTIMGFEVGLWLLLVVSAVIAAIVTYLIFSSIKVAREIVVLLVGGSLGAFLGLTIPPLSAIFILLLLAVYDIIAVYYGPVGEIASHGLENLPGISFSFKEVHIGLGDLTFYSMLISHALIYFGEKACIFSVVGVLLGSFLAFKLLEKRGMFPGLPIPIVLGLVLMYFSSLI
ncbi:MAG TPA: hypothetical protein ENG10_03815 [Candidatus Bathyarchaeota archaeon]|nr:hypothetical protein [Candidatus Bathyarchaeota archaeon]HEX69402.1 hypothetical protein [Candidatus Bathyarchaeota archaeon]